MSIPNSFTIKADRLAAWVLFISIGLYFITGFIMGSNGYHPDAAAFHTKVLPPISIIALGIHTYFAICLACIRHKWWNRSIRFSLTTAYIIAIIVAFSLYISETKTPVLAEAETISANQTQTANSTSSTSSQTQTSNSSDSTVFTLEELAQYNGKNGQPSYVAVDGVVYDLSTVFKNGTHFGFSAGQDLTDAFYTKHVKSQITKYPVVGTLE